MEPVVLIDCAYGGPRHAAAYLLTSDNQAAFIDNNTQFAIPHLLAALHKQGLSPEAVVYLIITHVHLDHAGGTAALAAVCPNATVLAHPRATPHLINPAALIAGAASVYGKEAFARMYGEILPLTETRIRSMEDEETVALGSRTLRFLHTPGHANHHFCIHDSETNSVFTGDTFGVGYDPLRKSDRPFLHFSSSPIQFDPEAARSSIDRILALNPKQVCLSHYGIIEDVAGAATVLNDSLRNLTQILEDAVRSNLSGDSLLDWCRDRVRNAIYTLAKTYGVIFSSKEQEELKLNIDVDAQGIAWVAAKRRR